MSALQTINLGTAPTGSDGDAVRTAFIKDNANIAILNTQSALYSAALVTAAQTLTPVYIGKRVNINLSTAGTINLPAAAACALDQVTLLRNLGSTVVTLAVSSGSGDTLSVSKLNPGETALLDTDGVHAWTCLMRGRTNSDNEVVNGNCAVNGNETVAGTLSVLGAASFGATAQASISAAGAYAGPSAAYANNVTVGGTLGVTGAATFTIRPTFATATPWDSLNLPRPVTSLTNKFNLGWGTSPQPNITMALDGGANYGSFVLMPTPHSLILSWTGSAIAAQVDGSPLGNITLSSDYRAKQNVKDLEGDSLTIVNSLRPVTYEWRDFAVFKADGKTQAGFIAHEVQAIIPSAATGEKDGVDADGNPVIQSLNLASVVAHLTKALQSALKRIAALEDKQ